VIVSITSRTGSVPVVREGKSYFLSAPLIRERATPPGSNDDPDVGDGVV